jgi:hypothetical protein
MVCHVYRHILVILPLSLPDTQLASWANRNGEDLCDDVYPGEDYGASEGTKPRYTCIYAEEGRTSMDILAKFFKKNAGDSASFTMYHLAMGCVSNMVAGSDTTAITL